MFNYNILIADRSSETLAKCRTNAKLSRKRMSEEIGVSESTIKAWEVGQGSPTIPMLLKWFKATGCNPFRFLLDFFWPDSFLNLSRNSSEERIRNAISVYLREVATRSEIEQLHFLVFEDFGGDWLGLLDMFCAHINMNLGSRYRIAEMIQTSYELSLANNRARDLKGVKVNKIVLLGALQEAKKASMTNKFGYTVGSLSRDMSEISSIILTRSRQDSGVSQRYMAKAMGKSERTIQNWEGSSEPSFLEVCTWFHILNKNVLYYLRNALNPEEPVEVDEKDKALREDLVKHFDLAGMDELCKVSYLVFGDHGSYWSAVLELMIEHICTPLDQRVMMARAISVSYELDGHERILQDKSILPDMDYLNMCIKLSTEAAKQGENSYKVI